MQCGFYLHDRVIGGSGFSFVLIICRLIQSNGYGLLLKEMERRQTLFF